MKSSGIFNQPISSLISGMGHTDSLVISDAGLPIPPGPQRIDLALRCGLPTFLEVLETVLGELEVERAVIAEQTRETSPKLHEGLLAILGEVPVDYVDHQEFKARSVGSKGIIRTGECTPFANVILYSGVVF